MIYQDQVLLRSFKDFWEESFEDVIELIALKDNTLSHKKMCISVRQ